MHRRTHDLAAIRASSLAFVNNMVAQEQRSERKSKRKSPMRGGAKEKEKEKEEPCMIASVLQPIVLLALVASAVAALGYSVCSVSFIDQGQWLIASAATVARSVLTLMRPLQSWLGVAGLLILDLLMPIVALHLALKNGMSSAAFTAYIQKQQELGSYTAFLLRSSWAPSVLVALGVGGAAVGVAAAVRRVMPKRKPWTNPDMFRGEVPVANPWARRDAVDADGNENTSPSAGRKRAPASAPASALASMLTDAAPAWMGSKRDLARDAADAASVGSSMLSILKLLTIVFSASARFISLRLVRALGFCTTSPSKRAGHAAAVENQQVRQLQHRAKHAFATGIKTIAQANPNPFASAPASTLALALAPAHAPAQLFSSAPPTQFPAHPLHLRRHRKVNPFVLSDTGTPKNLFDDSDQDSSDSIAGGCKRRRTRRPTTKEKIYTRFSAK